jgi:hypothetical protein
MQPLPETFILQLEPRFCEFDLLPRHETAWHGSNQPTLTYLRQENIMKILKTSFVLICALMFVLASTGLLMAQDKDSPSKDKTSSPSDGALRVKFVPRGAESTCGKPDGFVIGSIKPSAPPSGCDKTVKKCASKNAGTAKSTAPAKGRKKT